MERTDDDNNNNNEPTRVASGRNGPSIALIAFLLVAAYVIAFFFRNSRETEVDYVFGETDTTLRWALLLAVALGVVLDRLVTSWWRRRHR
jgi:uncharacterized integral membrane protein